MTIYQTWIQIPTTSLSIDAYEAYPLETEVACPPIVVLQEIFGVNSHIRSVVDRLAKAGYRAIAPALYQRTAPGFEVGYSEADVVIGRHHKDSTTAVQLLSDIRATIAYLKSCPGVDGQRGVGCIGFCFGGHVAYLAATLPEIKATASFYGAGIPTFTPGGGEPTLHRTPEIQGTIYGFYGMADPLIPGEHIDQIEQALQSAKIPHRIFRYPEAGHGFCCDQRSDYRPAVCSQAWTEVMKLFEML